jgi:hypothetical protein
MVVHGRLAGVCLRRRNLDMNARSETQVMVGYAAFFGWWKQV